MQIAIEFETIKFASFAAHEPARARKLIQGTGILTRVFDAKQSKRKIKNSLN